MVGFGAMKELGLGACRHCYRWVWFYDGPGLACECRGYWRHNVPVHCLVTDGVGDSCTILIGDAGLSNDRDLIPGDEKVKETKSLRPVKLGKQFWSRSGGREHRWRD